MTDDQQHREQKECNTQITFTKNAIVRGVITVAVLIALYVLLRKLSSILLPFVISFMIAYILAPVVRFFQNTCKLKNRIASVIVTMVLVLGILYGAIVTIVPAIAQQASSLSVSINNYLENWDTTLQLPPQINEKVQEVIQSIDANAQLTATTSEGTTTLPALGNLVDLGKNALKYLAVAYICLMYIILLLVDYEQIASNWHTFIPERYSDKIQKLVSDLDRNMNAYFRGQALVATCNGILFAIGFQIIDLPMAIGLGLMIGVLNLVPYMQALGIVPAALLGFIQAAETGRPIWVVLLCIAAVFIVVQVIENLILIPTIMGEVTGLGPAWILLSLAIWGALLGFIGMIIALPVTTLLVSYYKRYVLHMPEAPPQTVVAKRQWWKRKKK
jgi:predicted PurR-regulated permease PerM